MDTEELHKAQYFRAFLRVRIASEGRERTLREIRCRRRELKRIGEAMIGSNFQKYNMDNPKLQRSGGYEGPSSSEAGDTENNFMRILTSTGWPHSKSKGFHMPDPFV